MSRDIREMADAVYKTVWMTDEADRAVAFDVCVMPDGLYMRVRGQKRYVGPLRWHDAYVEVCRKHQDSKPARTK
jgi:hypothetical protein